jgi:hypothetical protein
MSSRARFSDQHRARGERGQAKCQVSESLIAAEIAVLADSSVIGVQAKSCSLSPNFAGGALSRGRSLRVSAARLS